MSVNRELPHIFVLPEDDANVRLANEFHQQLDFTKLRRMQVLRAAGGWNEVIDIFKSVHAIEMDRCQCRFMVLLIDFDNRTDRLDLVKAEIPNHLANRVFVLGSFSTPEALKAQLGSYEKIGADLAADCRDGTSGTWGHELLRHNARELERLREHVYPFLFA